MSVVDFKNISQLDNVGGKGLSLAKMSQNGFNVPDGFVVTAEEFDNFLLQNNLKDDINNLINTCDADSQEEIEETSRKIIEMFESCEVPSELENEILNKFANLNSEYVAVRSSATSEDGKNHAWAGTLETSLNVNKENIINAVKKCWQSVFKPRALFYRIKNENDKEINVAVVVQKMIQSDISGVTFSINPTTNSENEMLIEAVYGLGEAIVSGAVTPDSYIVDKEKMEIKSKDIGVQKTKLIYQNGENIWVPVDNGDSQKLEDSMILKLSQILYKLQEFYGFPVDVEWGTQNNTIYILQCRPITTIKEESLMEKVKSFGKWKFYVSRKFNWFVEKTEIYGSLGEYQKKLLGFELPTYNYLCLNGDEYALDSDFELWKDILDKHFESDIAFFEKFAKTEFDLVEKMKDYLEKSKSIDYSALNWKELKEKFEAFNSLYIDSFIPGMTRPEDYLTDKLKNELTNLNYEEKDIDNIFAKVSTCPSYAPLSYSEEPLELLRIAQKVKEVGRSNLEEMIENHTNKYAWIKGPVEFKDTCFTKEDYMERLENLLDTDIDAKIENITKTRINDEMEYEKLLTRYNFTEKIKKLLKAIRDFIFLRTYTTEYSDHLFYNARNTIFEVISKKSGLSKLDLLMLDDKDILDIMDNEGNIKSEIMGILEKRKIGFAMIWMNKNISTVFGKESIELQKEIARVFKNDEGNGNTEKQDVITGKIANKGIVKGIARVLTTYEDIYKVNKGDIIVASMTTPDYVSAMEKAAGFITDEGGITCHAAILSREFNVPCIVGTVNATEKIKDGEMIELDAYNGKVYKVK